MNGAILYPTDDEIIALRKSEENREYHKDFLFGMRSFIESWNIAVDELKLEPLKINETVLG